MDKYKCQECGSIMEREELGEFLQEHEAWGRPVYERFTVCPHCGGDVYTYEDPEDDEDDECE